MSPIIDQIRIRSENGENITQNACAKSRTSSTPLCKIETYGNKLSSKSEDIVMLYSENFNSLPKTKSGFHLDKSSSLRHVWSKLKADFISLVES